MPHQHDTGPHDTGPHDTELHDTELHGADQPPPDHEEGATPSTAYRSRAADKAAARAKIQYQQSWVEHQIQQAQRRGDFDHVAGTGEPLAEDLSPGHDPDWWVKKLVEREQIAVLPPALAVRTEDAALDDRLDGFSAKRDVRRELEEFNARVRYARRQLRGGPPCITPERDVETEVAAWRDRREARRAAQQAAEPPVGSDQPSGRSRRWFRRRGDGGPG